MAQTESANQMKEIIALKLMSLYHLSFLGGKILDRKDMSHGSDNVLLEGS